MHSPLAYLTIVLCLGIVAQWVAWRIKMPSILLLLLFGFLTGQFFMRPDAVIEDSLLFPFVSLSVAIILCEGGLSLRLRELRAAGKPVIRLCTIGAILSGVLTTIAGHYLVGLHWRVACLLGAILIVTGPTVIAPLLRTINPNRHIRAIVKWEGIVIDPIGATFALLVFQAVSASSVGGAAATIAISVLSTLAIGIGLGMLAGALVTWLLAKHVIPDFQHGVFLIVCVAALFTASDMMMHESGLLTVTVFGVYLANQKRVSVKHIITFKENLRILLISTLFIVLSGRISWGQLAELGWSAILFPLALIFIVRPLSVMISCAGTRLSKSDRIFLSFLAPRGIVAAAVTSVFALELTHAVDGNPELESLAAQADLLVPLTFVTIVGTVTFCGLFAAPLARRLGLSHKKGSGILFVGADPWVLDIAAALQDEEQAVLVVDTNHENIKKARLAGIPAQRGNILSDIVEEDLELTGIANLLAVTSNDHVNSMAVHDFTHQFGRAHVFQLQPENSEETIERDKAPEHFVGRIAFPETPTNHALRDLHQRGFTVKKTELTKRFTFEDFSNIHGGETLLLFRIHNSKRLEVLSNEETTTWKPGQKIIALVPPVEVVASSK
ncbi:MAG: NhaP-type Na+/H+ or K+/H+ antiporter [Verrucomicrobiales bacterium]|jgi:NhaP-type Na+/H+ or K+/H+ antiporter